MAAVVLAGVAAAPVANAETLADALVAAYRNSNLLDQNRAVLRAADEDVAQALSSLRPVVQFTALGGWRKAELDTALGVITTEGLSSSLLVSAQLTLFDFGRNELGIAIAKESVLATRQALIDVEQQVLLAAVQAYVDVRRAEEVVSLQQANFRLLTEELGAAQDRFDVGEITRTDVAIAESRLAQSRAGLASAEGQLMVARESYKAAIGAYPGKLAGVPSAPKLPRTLAEAQSVALKTHPILLQAQHLVAIAERQVDFAKADLLPTIGAQASVSRDNDGLDEQTVGIELNQTLYAGGRLSSVYRQALAGKDRASAELQQTAVLIAQGVGVSWANLEISAASIEATTQQVEAARTAFVGVREEAAVGARTTLDVLDAEQELLDARNAQLEAIAQKYIAIYQVLSSLGLLTVDHLQLGIPTYDPEAYYDAVKNAPSTSPQGKKLDRILKKIGN
ncbi:TolC family outer membrane protein [Tabrizicola sp. BL-A-41-H6]|uniref:TolC family outer membrane protein n=1 Tax=Tabrizicola sp. BL-A-41-H6 TaxID=3421107 RepID=UPI003D67CA5E